MWIKASLTFDDGEGVFTVRYQEGRPYDLDPDVAQRFMRARQAVAITEREAMAILSGPESMVGRNRIPDETAETRDAGSRAPVDKPAMPQHRARKG